MQYAAPDLIGQVQGELQRDGELTENKGVCRGDISFLTGWAGSQIQITPETRTWMESPVQGLSKTGPRSRKGILEPKLFHRVDRI